MKTKSMKIKRNKDVIDDGVHYDTITIHNMDRDFMLSVLEQCVTNEKTDDELMEQAVELQAHIEQLNEKGEVSFF